MELQLRVALAKLARLRVVGARRAEHRELEWEELRGASLRMMADPCDPGTTILMALPRVTRITADTQSFAEVRSFSAARLTEITDEHGGTQRGEPATKGPQTGLNKKAGKVGKDPTPCFPISPIFLFKKQDS